MRWTVCLEGGPKRVNHAAVAIGDKIYSFGGYCTNGNYSIMYNIDVHILDTVTLRWKEHRSTGKPDEICFQRYGHTVVEYKGKIYLWGGRNEIQACNKLFCFDPVTLTWSCPKLNSPEPIARDGHSACVIGDTMYIFAGYLDVPGVFTQEICAFNFKTLCWEDICTKGLKPMYRDYHTANGIGHLMYVWGGREVPSGWDFDGVDGEYGTQMYVFDTITKRWSSVDAYGDIPIGRRSHSAVVHNEKIYVFGGFNSRENCTHYNDLHCFNPETGKWVRLKPRGRAPSPRRRQALCLVDSKGFLFGGTSPSDSQIVNDEFEMQNKLIDNCDLFILDLDPSLKTLAIVKVIECKLDPTCLPRDLQVQIKVMTQPNKILNRSICSGPFD